MHPGTLSVDSDNDFISVSNLDLNDNIDDVMPEGEEGAYTNPMRGGIQLGGEDKVSAGMDWGSEEGEFLPVSHSRHIDGDESAAGCSFWVPEERNVTAVRDVLALQVEIPTERVRVQASPVSAPEVPHCAFELNSTHVGPCRLCALLEELDGDIFAKAIPLAPLKTLQERGRRKQGIYCKVGPPSTSSQGPPSTPREGPPSTTNQGPPPTSSQTAVRTSAEISPSASPSPRQSTNGKRKRTVSSEESADIQRQILKILKAPEAKPDGVDGFLVLIGEGLRRLPLRNRNRLHIKYLQMLEEEECALEIEK